MAMRYCVKCGEAVLDGQRFCKRCGAPIRAEMPVPSENGGDDEASDEKTPEHPMEEREEVPSVDETLRMEGTLADQTSNAGSAGDDSEHRYRHRNKAIIIAAVLLAILAGAMGGVVLYFGDGLDSIQSIFSPPDGETTSLSRNVRIVPKMADGSTPQHYFVRVKRAVDVSGNEIDVSSTPTIEVTDGTGFVPEDLIAGLPDGNYTFEIETNKGTTELSQTDLSENGKGEAGEAVEVTGGGSATDFDELPPKTADDLFLEKIEELESAYGESKIRVTEASSAQGGYCYGYASGLAFAELIDFGDGVERLVVIYYDGDGQEDPKYSDYHLQVWEYDGEAKGLRCVYGENGSAPLMDGTLEESLVDYSSSLTIYSTKDASILNYGYTISFSSTQTYVGIAENGSFGLIHNIETVGDVVDTRVVRRYLVDGVEVNDEEYQNIQKSIGIVSNDVTLRWCYLIESYTSESEAKDGMRPSNSVEQNNSEFYVYPGEMVQQVKDTKKLLQDRIDGRGSAQDGTDAEAAVAREITETVEVPTFYTGYDKSDGMERHTWGYLEITGGASDDVLSAINETLHNEYEEVKGESVDKSEPNTGEGDCTAYRSLLTCGRDGLLGTCVMQYRTNWGAHGSIQTNGHIYDLSSGEELDPWEVAGMSKSELDNAAVEAVASYAMDNPGNIVYTTEAEAQNDAREVLGSCEYLLTNDGIVISLSPYAMGYPYQDITNKIVVWTFDDPALVGTNVAGQFSLDFWD